jgi:transcriptional regulator with XRE-family HTH domain
MNNSKEDRFKEVRNHFQLSQNDFAQRMGMSKITVSKIEAGENKVGPGTQRNLLNAFSEINPDWFVLGRGEMLIEKTKKQESKSYLIDDDGTSESIIVKNGRTYLDVTNAFNMYFSEIELISQLLYLKQKNWKSTMDALNEKIKSKEF